MAYFIRGASASTTPTQHSRQIWTDYLKQQTLKGMFGKPGSGKPITIDTTLKANPGDTVRYHFVPQDESDGIQGQNAAILGNEAAISEYYFDLTVDVETQAYRKKGKMTDQRTIFDIRKRHTMQLTNWWKNRNEVRLYQALTGVLVNTTYTWAATTDLVNGDHRCVRADGASSYATVTAANSDNTALGAAMNTGDKMSVELIENAAIQARTAGTYKMRPFRVGPDGEEFFVLIMDLYAARDLMATARWQNHALSVVQRGIDKDPIARGALGVWNNVILKQSERVLRFSATDENSATTYFGRNLLIGADALVLGYAQTTDYTEELIDHKTTLSSAASEIRGECKVRFDETDGTYEDAGVMQVIAVSQ